MALVDNRTVLVLRIRWASTDYLVNGKGSYPYFNTPEDQLIEFPGFVYHCHFLQHEDNKLMRSFQMMPSDKFDEYYNMSDYHAIEKEKWEVVLPRSSHQLLLNHQIKTRHLPSLPREGPSQETTAGCLKEKYSQKDEEHPF